MAEISFVYVTAPSTAEAERIGGILVHEGLAGCVNVIPGMRSIYRWQGRVERAEEAALIVKIPATAYATVAARIRTLHPYSTPCIIEIPIGRGDAQYLAWLAAACAGPQLGQA
jgi:periplasmic divalent cation tolerance protein